eukprot:XP_011667390.1 PREDICTED: uncharacterized protein LOC105439737 [Strongylocentrotus purpuratus]
MTEASDRNGDLMIVGDLNLRDIDWARNVANCSEDHPACYILDNINDLYLSQRVTQPTRFREGQRESLLDLVLTNNDETIDIVNVNPPWSTLLPLNYALPGNVILARINGTIATFIQDLLDDTTKTFKNVALELQAQLDKIYQNTSGFIGSRVVSFRSGSIIANFILIFNPTSSITEVEANEIFRSALTSDAEITSGSGLFLTSLTAFNISFPCEDLTCENGGSCIITNDGSGARCRCTEGWTGDRCQTSTNTILIVGTTAGALFFFILILVLCMHALRNRMMMKYQGSRGHSRPTSTFRTRDYNSRDHRVPSRENPIAHHKDRSRDRSHRNDNMDRDMALFTQYKSREQRRASQNFKTGPSFTGRAPSHEPLQSGNHRMNRIPLRDTYYYRGQIYL